MIKYNFIPEYVGSSGVEIHSDYGFLTEFQDDEIVGGLEVMNKYGESVAVNPWPGTLLVNLGDVTVVYIEIIEMYSGAAYKVAVDMGRRIAKSFRVVREYDHLFDDWPCPLRMNKYSFTCGVQLHTNPGFLTILLQDEIVGGLEVVDDKSGEFVAVDPWPGTLLVNLGDSAKAWSNGRFCNVKYRVLCKEASIRVSISLFLMGPKKAAIGIPPELVDSKHPRLYIPFIYEDYLNLQLYTNMKTGEALQLVRTTANCFVK